MALQTIFSEKSANRQLVRYGSGALAAGLILPDDFNAASGTIAKPSEKIWTPEDQDGYSMQGGILQQDRQLYVPQKTYFFPSQICVSAKKSATSMGGPAPAGGVAASGQSVSTPESKHASRFNMIDALLLEEQQETPEQRRDMNWFGRLHDAVVQGINNERAAMGLPTLQDEAAKRRPDFH
jgi:hypothetical protein